MFILGAIRPNQLLLLDSQFPIWRAHGPLVGATSPLQVSSHPKRKQKSFPRKSQSADAPRQKHYAHFKISIPKRKLPSPRLPISASHQAKTLLRFLRRRAYPGKLSSSRDL
jgi:hypothetical protein